MPFAQSYWGNPLPFKSYDIVNLRHPPSPLCEVLSLQKVFFCCANTFDKMTDSTKCQFFQSWVSQLRIQRFVNSSVSEETLRELLRGDFSENTKIFHIKTFKGIKHKKSVHRIKSLNLILRNGFVFHFLGRKTRGGFPTRQENWRYCFFRSLHWLSLSLTH